MNSKISAFSATIALGLVSLAVAQTPPLTAITAPPSTPLISGEVRDFMPYGAQPGRSSLEVVSLDGPIPRAARIASLAPTANFWDYGATSKITAPVHKGDVLWVSMQLRRVKTLRESGEAQAEIAFLQTVEGKEVRPLERLVSFGAEWTSFSLPFVVQNDSGIGEARLALRYGYGVQSFEVGDVKLLDYGPNVALETLPRTLIRYDGWKPDAPWRAAAAQRIEKIRKGDLRVTVVDETGKPVLGAKVEVRMKRHAFAWGTAIDEARLTDTKDPDNERYRQTIDRYFNKVVFENDLKWGRWPASRPKIEAALPYLQARQIPVRGHVMVWPSWEHLPPALFTDDVKRDPAAIQKLVSDHIAGQTAALGNRLTEWDVANETFKHHDLLDILGRDALADWFRQARAGAPKVKLFYNDYTMFQPGEGSDYFFNTVKELKDKGAPIDAIGEQGHFASNPPGIPSVLSTLDHFGTLGLPIQISEFDIDTDDTALQADYMRDFSIAVFSHPAVMGVVQWGFWEGAHWLPRAALWDKNWNLRPHGKVWTDLVFKTWWTNADGATDGRGNYAMRGFYGDYEITVSSGGKTQISEFALAPQNGALNVILR